MYIAAIVRALYGYNCTQQNTEQSAFPSPFHQTIGLHPFACCELFINLRGSRSLQHMPIKQFAKHVLQKIKKIFLVLFIVQLLYIIILRWVFPPITVIQLGDWMNGHGLKRHYVSLQDISPHARLAVIASEDQLFPDHSGFDWKSIEKAIAYNQKKPGRIRGASTISQQVAKNVFLWNGRSWIRKGFETYFTFMIEKIWGKRRILEVYLNVAEMGKGIFGIEAASQHYFKKPAKKITATEAAMIAASLPNPKKYTVKPLSSIVRRRYPWVQQQMLNLRGDPDIRLLLQDDVQLPLGK